VTKVTERVTTNNAYRADIHRHEVHRAQLQVFAMMDVGTRVLLDCMAAIIFTPLFCHTSHVCRQHAHGIGKDKEGGGQNSGEDPYGPRPELDRYHRERWIVVMSNLVRCLTLHMTMSLQMDGTQR